jgi:hypothetical protein
MDRSLLEGHELAQTEPTESRSNGVQRDLWLPVVADNANHEEFVDKCLDIVRTLERPAGMGTIGVDHEQPVEIAMEAGFQEKVKDRSQMLFLGSDVRWSPTPAPWASRPVRVELLMKLKV